MTNNLQRTSIFFMFYIFLAHCWYSFRSYCSSQELIGECLRIAFAAYTSLTCAPLIHNIVIFPFLYIICANKSLL